MSAKPKEAAFATLVPWSGHHVKLTGNGHVEGSVVSLTIVSAFGALALPPAVSAFAVPASGRQLAHVKSGSQM
jgi:hypothetical protein